MWKTVVISSASVVLTLLVIVGVAWAADIFTVDKDGTVRMVITDTGNVGIGTASPNERLSVVGNIRISDGFNPINIDASSAVDGRTLSIQNTQTNIGTFLAVSPSGTVTDNWGGGVIVGKTDINADGTNFERLEIMASNNGGGTGHRYSIHTSASGTGQQRPLSLGVGWMNQALTIDTSNRVGIGTTDPKTKLHVTGLPEYANNAAALAAGLTAGAFYRTGEFLKVVY